jgi:hypothetical protein
MYHDGENTVYEVSQGQLVIEGLGCYGFALKPEPGNAGKYPVTAIINEDNGNPLTVEGPHVYKGDEAISTIKVLVGSDGREGDKWRIVRQRRVADACERAYNTDTSGRLITTNGGGELLFYIDTRKFNPFQDWPTDVEFQAFLDPSDPKRSSFIYAGLGQAWPGDAYVDESPLAGFDWSRFRRVSVYVETYRSAGYQPWVFNIITPFVRVVSPRAGTVLQTYTFGGLGNIAVSEEYPYPYDTPTPLVVELGAPAEYETAYTRGVTNVPPYIQVGLEARFGGASPQAIGNPFPSANYRLRMWAVGSE